jgi:multiple sugar transport system permease protein
MAKPASQAVPGSQNFGIGHFILLLLVIMICVFPFYWMVTTSFKEQAAILSSTPQFFFQGTLGNYSRAFEKFDIGASLINSLVVALSTTALSLLLGAPAAYAIARSGKTEAQRRLD